MRCYIEWNISLVCSSLLSWCVPFQLLFTPWLSAGGGEGRVRNRKSLIGVQAVLSNSWKQPKHSSVTNTALTPDLNLALYSVLLRNVMLSQSSHQPQGVQSKGIPDLDTALQMCLTRPKQRGGISPINLLAAMLLQQSRMLLAAFATRAHCWPTISFFPRAPGPFLQNC